MRWLFMEENIFSVNRVKSIYETSVFCHFSKPLSFNFHKTFTVEIIDFLSEVCYNLDEYYRTDGSFIIMKRLLTCLLAILTFSAPLSSCGSPDTADTDLKNENNILSFESKHSISELQELDGECVSIVGFMSTITPDSGAFLYLKSMPYQSCPFCVPNTTQLANTMAVYAKSKKGFEFTDRAIQVTGILEFGNYTDEFGYEYNYRIKDAEYTILDEGELDPKLELWQQLASTDIISEVYKMYEYLNFICFWPTYTAQFEGGSDYIYPEDMPHFYQTEGAQYNYGYSEGYFDSIIATIEKVSTTDFTALVENIRKVETLAAEAIAEIEAGNYTSLPEYSGTFSDGRNQYKMNRADEFETAVQETYGEFAAWLATWEL